MNISLKDVQTKRKTFKQKTTGFAAPVVEVTNRKKLFSADRRITTKQFAVTFACLMGFDYHAQAPASFSIIIRFAVYHALILHVKSFVNYYQGFINSVYGNSGSVI